MTDVALESPLRWLGGLIDIKVEAEADTPGQWVDITEYVERVTTRTGQEKWGSRFTAGSCQLTLDNTAGYFTPATGASLSGLTWRPGVTVRIRALPDPEDPDVSHSLFTGRVQSSTDSYNAATGDVTTQVLLLDVLADLHQFNPPALDTPVPNGQSTSERVHAALNRYGFPPARRRVQGGLHSMQSSTLAQSTLEECQRAVDAEGGALFADPDNNLVFRQRDWLVGGRPSMGNYETAVLARGPVAYWRFTGNGRFDASGNGHHLVWQDAVEGDKPPSSVGGVTSDDDAIQLPLGGAAVTDEGPLEIRSNLTIEGWFRTPPGLEAFTLIECDGDSLIYKVGYTPTGGGTIYFDADWLPTPVNIDNVGLFGAEWYHFAFTVAWAGNNWTVTAYLDGAVFDTAAGTTTPPGAGTRTVTVAEAAGTDAFARLSELAIYDHTLTSDDVAALYEAVGLSLNDRSVNVQAEIGFPSGPPIVDARVSWDVARVRNHITFARTGGTVQVAEDTASQNAYGPRTYQRLDLQNNSNTAVLLLAQRTLAAWKDDRIRVDQVTVAARADDPAFHKLFYDAQLGDLVSVRINPRPGFTYDVTTHIIGISHSITPSDWTVTLNLDDSLVAQEP